MSFNFFFKFGIYYFYKKNSWIIDSCEALIDEANYR
jgi:hypothetical protein